MSALRQATTWEISDSDESDAEVKACAKSSGVGVKETTSGEFKGEHSSPPPAASPSDVPLTPGGRVGAARRRRSKEEVETDRRRARLRREEREQQGRARALEKELKRQEQQRRREAAENVKALRPENLIRSLRVHTHPDLLQQEGSDILLDALAVYDWRLIIDDQLLTHSITWTRDLPQEEDGKLFVVEEQMVVVQSLTNFMDLVINVRKMLHGDEDDEEGEAQPESTLGALLEFLNRNPKTGVTLLVMRPNYWSTALSVSETLQAKLSLNHLDIEEVLVYLQLNKNASVVFVDGWQDITHHVCTVTKALAKRPFKLLTERSDLPFCVDGSWSSGVRVEKDGAGLIQVWNKQIQQMNRVSHAVASAVTSAYPSPRLLLQAYQSLECEEDRKKLLAGLKVNKEGKERRIGAEISSRVYRCFTAKNPQLVLD